MRKNIAPAGRWARGISGILFLGLSGCAWYYGYPEGSTVLTWTVGIVGLLFGGFQIFESLSGWCIIRALGFRTPM